MKSLQPTAELEENGFCILPAVFGAVEIDRFRAGAIRCLDMMGQTRNVDHSYHLAGFHRFAELTDMHSSVASNATINGFLADYYSGSPYYAIGLSDITVNRSQQWHTDLLRGPYSRFLETVDPWAQRAQGCIKALLYLQSGRSLRIVPGSHRSPSPLDDAMLDRLARSQGVLELKVEAGDVVMMDIRSLHRGSTDEEMSRPELAQAPKILVSTVFGPIGSAFTEAMQLGNAHRMADWDRLHLGHKM